MQVVALSPEEATTAVDALLREEPFLDYAHFEPIAARAGALVELYRGRWHEPAGESGLPVLVCRDEDGRPLAAARLGHREFESSHFGFPMARIDAPLAVGDESVRRAALAAVYSEAASVLGSSGYTHVAARVSTRDAAGAWSLQEAGARHVDTQVSWMAELGDARAEERAPQPLSSSLSLRVLEGDDIAALPPASWRAIHEFSVSGFDRGPLVFDLDLPRNRARDVYAAWTENVMTGKWADALLTAWDGDRVVAFISMLELPDVSCAAGCKVCGRGLGATLPGYRGLFTAIQRAMIARAPLGACYMENETQAATVASINVYAKLGFRYQRSTCTYHLRPGGSARP